MVSDRETEIESIFHTCTIRSYRLVLRRRVGSVNVDLWRAQQSGCHKSQQTVSPGSHMGQVRLRLFWILDQFALKVLLGWCRFSRVTRLHPRPRLAWVVNREILLRLSQVATLASGAFPQTVFAHAWSGAQGRTADAEYLLLSGVTKKRCCWTAMSSRGMHGSPRS